MALFLPEPETKKISSEMSNSKLICGSSSMQGWPATQEDAHNCILDYDTDTSFFAIYNGHLGHEVALYCSENLPDFLKQMGPYKTGDLKKALEDAYLGLDAKIAASDIVMKIDYEDKDDEEEEDDEDLECEVSDEENMYDLYEEASMPIEQVMEKYASKLSYSPDESQTHFTTVSKEKRSGSILMRKNRRNESVNASCSSKSSLSQAPVVVSSSSNMKTEASSSSIDKIGKKELSKTSTITEKRVDSPDSSVNKNDTWVHSNKAKDISAVDSSNQNGEVESSQGSKSSNCEVVTSSSMPQENGTVSKKGKGKALMKTKGMKPPKINTQPKRSARQLYNKLIDFQEDSDEEDYSEDEDDKDFIGANEDSSDDDINISINDQHSDEDSSDEDEEEKEEEIIGFNCGCTALVALIRDKELYVGNAGDSRCLVCRNGKAIELSSNHKPTNKEQERINKAGGYVTQSGKVNDELNLSRTIGDRKYKQNKELPDQEQMITAFPKVQSLTLVPDEDEFMFLASDGIWSCMDNQQVIDLIRSKLREGKKELSKICEDIFDKCLAKTPTENGNGNMTAIIVQFKLNLLKRSADDFKESDSSKKLKTEETVDSTEPSY